MLVPAFIACLLILWQLVILGMAMMHTQAAVRDVARVLAATDDEEKAKLQAKQSFPTMDSYRIEKLSMKKKDGQAVVQIQTEVKLVLLQTPYRFHFQQQAVTPLVNERKQTKSIAEENIPIIHQIPN